MIVLDSDHLSVFEYPEADQAVQLRERLRLSSDRDIYTTAVSLEEQMRGWLAAIHRRQDVRLQVTCYSRLVDLVRFYANWRILPFDDQAAKEFQRLRRERVRIGTMDLKIASIALINDAMLLSANLRDFEQVPGLRAEDWIGE
ncbi:MAG: type II toxin-antitoxin system VapC family toxin [Planctomycetes bacterium]|nr:type II toxin-antitoxin system VapC family toxin [Planctomycetota bacterium]